MMKSDSQVRKSPPDHWFLLHASDFQQKPFGGRMLRVNLELSGVARTKL